MLTIFEPPPAIPFAGRPNESDSLSRRDFIHSLLDTDMPETSALLTMIAAMSEDEVECSRIRRTLAARTHTLPTWVGAVGHPVAYRGIEMVHVLGDGDDIVVGVRFPTGHELSILVYIDHNLGTVVKDAFALPLPIDEALASMQRMCDDPDTVFREVDLADARARITDAVELGAITFPPFETDTWPVCRPLVRWITRMLPEGGTGYVRSEWGDEDLEALKSRFFSSPFAAPLRDPDLPGLLDSLLWFATEDGSGDPLRWSPVAVEILLTGWIPQKIVARPGYLAKVPALLRAFIAFAHRERGVRPELTTTTLAAVDTYEPEYQRAIRSPRPQGTAALLAALGVSAADDSPYLAEDDEPTEYWEIMLNILEDEVGSKDALANLDEEPLPDEPFDWTDIAEDVRSRVEEVLELCDRCCEEILDIEFRTACRRILAEIARGDSEIFRRKARSDTAAAAVCWIIGKANELFSHSTGHMSVKEFMSHFGLQQGSVSQRAATMLKAAGLDQPAYGGIRLGTPKLLVSAERRRIITLRDRYLAIAAENA